MAMKMSFLTIALGSAALAAAPALAQHGGGHGGGRGGGPVNVGGNLGGGMGVSLRTEARMNSQGPAHAADRALDRANSNSVLSGTATTSLGRRTIVRGGADADDDLAGTGVTRRAQTRMHSQG